ncbi:MAG: HIT family protein [Candidatus Binatia bacterium]
MAYIGAPKEVGCIFCRLPDAADQQGALVLARTPHAVVVMNRYPYGNGHVMVAPRLHSADLLALPADAYAGLCETLRQSLGVLQRFFTPDGVNVGMNLGAAAGAGIADHLHWHLVPRWVGDTNFMPLIGEVRSMPEHLEALWARLRPVFAPLDASREA